jgi:hypothetical protein
MQVKYSCMFRFVILGSEWTDPYDPTVIAENELLSAANSIEAAARKLSQLPTHRAVPRVCNTSYVFSRYNTLCCTKGV